MLVAASLGLAVGALLTVALWVLLAWLLMRWLGVLPRKRHRS